MKVVKEIIQWIGVFIIAPILFVIMILTCLLNLFLYLIYDDYAELNIREIKR